MTDTGAVFDLLWDTVSAWRNASQTKWLVFFDGATNVADDGAQTCGTAFTLPGTPAMGMATVFLGSCRDESIAATAAHEFVHALGASAPLASSAHTCPDDRDHVCDPTNDVLYPWAQHVALSSLLLDAGHDDYYGPAVQLGVQTSPWLRHPGDQAHLSVGIAGKGHVSSDIPGFDCAAACETDWDRGVTVPLTAQAARGARFVRWTGACSGGATCEVTLDSAKSVGAFFAPETYPLDLVVSGRGTVTSAAAGVRCARARCTNAVTSYERLTLSAKAAPGWRFTGWGGACRGSRPTCSLPMTQATSARAAFARR
jgi:hypothetical protein